MPSEFYALREAWLAVPESSEEVRGDARARLFEEISFEQPEARGRSSEQQQERRGLRPHSRLAIALVLALVLFLTWATLTLAFGWQVLFGSAERAPHSSRIFKEFSSLDLGAPPGMASGVIPNQTRLVATFGHNTLWVAPTKEGGLCYEFSRTGGGCDALGTVPLSVGWHGTGRGSPSSESFPTSFQAVAGFARPRWIDAVEVRLGDGSTVVPRLIWVSAPIEAGFYYYHAPQGRTVEAVLGLRDGEVVDSETVLRRGELEPPHPYADLSKRQRLAELETRDGTAALWRAPTKAGLQCTWLEFRGEAIAGLSSSCIPSGYEQQAGAGYAVYALGGDLVLAGTCGYQAAEFIHNDGTVRKVACADGVVFATLTPADASGEIAFVDENGRLLKGSRGRVPAPILRR